MVDMDVVNDDIGDVLEGDAATASDVDVGTTAIEGFVGVEDEFFGEVDDHVGGEDDPKGFLLYDSVPECAGEGIDGVMVGGIRDNVNSAAFAAEGVLAEANGAIGEALAVQLPVWIAPPAVVDWVAGWAYGCGGGG